MTGRPRSREAGFSLIEVLVTVVIVGIAFGIFVGGIGTAILGSQTHRKVATSQASIRNFAEAIKAAPYDPSCDTAMASYNAVYSPSPPTRDAAAAAFTNAGAHAAPSLQGANGYVLLGVFALARDSSFTPPGGMTEVYDRASNGAVTANRVTAMFSDTLLTTAGPTGTKTATSAAGDSVAQGVLLSPATGQSIVRRGFSFASASGTSIQIDKPTTPANTVAGNSMIAQIVVRGASTLVTPPPGWLLVNTKSNGSLKSLIYERTATSSATATYVWSFDSAQDAAGGIVTYSGVSQAFTASVTNVQCPRDGFEIVSLRVESVGGGYVESVDIVKRQP